jgi:formylglycine-generating enzyme required for sulfatase activity
MARVILAALALVTGFSLTALPARRPSHATALAGGTHPALLALGAGGAESPKDQAQALPEFKAAGVCARCHVVSVLEWGISKHVAAGTSCQKCHGPSKDHVANERNEVKPDRLPRGAQIAKTCQRCHDAGCPKTLQTATCQQCHHVHALLDPAKRPQAQDDQLSQLLARWEKFRGRMDEGERQVRLGQWKAARQAFQDALALIPGNHRAAMRLTFCKRRLDPSVSGFTNVGDSFDPQTGLAREVKVAGLDIPMVLVPPGEFDLGADQALSSRPVHTVTIEAFYLGKFELTQAQWQALMGANPSVHQGKAFADAGRMPVEHVSWHDCQALVKRLNERVPGGGFRLPTEAEWEYACRAGADAPPGRLMLGQLAWFRENSSRQPPGGDPSQGPEAWSPRPVGTKKPNAWGLYDMQGNVSEWCSSLDRPYPYDPRDGREALDGPGLRVLRGGNFADAAEGLDPALRHSERPQRRYRWNGVRLARSAPP